MANVLKTFFTAENGMSKPINARTHGIIDYSHATFFAVVALVLWRKNRNAALTAAGTSALVLVESLLTDYPLGKKPLIPFAVHGAMDAGSAALSFALPRLCGFSHSKARFIFQMNAVIESAVVATTDWDSQQARAAEHH